jgi:hypothetical protein
MKRAPELVTEHWWEVEIGSSRVFVVAVDSPGARRKAEGQLQDLGILPGGPPGLRESYKRMCESARRGRR